MAIIKKSIKTFKSYRHTRREHKEEGGGSWGGEAQERITTHNDTEEISEMKTVEEEETHENTKEKQPKNLMRRLGLVFLAFLDFIRNFLF